MHENPSFTRVFDEFDDVIKLTYSAANARSSDDDKAGNNVDEFSA